MAGWPASLYEADAPLLLGSIVSNLAGGPPPLEALGATIAYQNELDTLCAKCWVYSGAAKVKGFQIDDLEQLLTHWPDSSDETPAQGILRRSSIRIADQLDLLVPEELRTRPIPGSENW
jgi:hypothetical protein